MGLAFRGAWRSEIAGRDNMISFRNPTGRDLRELDSQNNEA